MKIKEFLLKYWPQLLLAIIVLVIGIINFVPGKYLISNDNYSPELNPSLTIERSLLSPAWRSYRGLGVPSDSEQADIIRSFLYEISSYLVGDSHSSQIYIFVCMLVGVVFVSLLSRNIVLRLGLKVSPNLVAFVSGLIYMTTLWSVWIYNFPMMPYVTQYGFTPLLLYALYLFIYNISWKNAFILWISLLLFTSASVISTLFIVTFIFISVFIWSTLFDFKGWRKRIKNILYAILIIVLSQIFWLLPFLTYVGSSSSQVQNSNINENITFSTIDVEESKMTSVNALRFYTQILDIYDNDFSEEKMFMNSNRYLSMDFYKILSYVPIAFVAIGFVFSIYYRNLKLIPIFLLFVVGWFGLKNVNPPFGSIYELLQDNFDIFRQVFRWPTSKFGTIYLVGLSLLASIGFAYFYSLISVMFRYKGRSFVAFLLLLLFISAQIVYGSFLFDKSLIAARNYSDIPDSYFNLKEFLEDDPNARIMQFPPPNNGYFREYRYGFYGSGFLHYLIPNPLLEKSLTVGSSKNEFAVSHIESLYFSRNFKELEYTLQNYGVKYIFVDRDLIRGRYGEQIDWKLLDEFVSQFNGAWEVGGLSLYELNSSSSSSDKVILNANANKYLFNGTSYFITDGMNGNIYPMSLSIDNLEVDSSYIRGGLDDSTPDSKSLKLDSSTEWGSLPTSLYLNTSTKELFMYPAVPFIGGMNIEAPAVKFNLDIDRIRYIIVGNNVVDINDINDSVITVDTNWSEDITLRIAPADSLIRNLIPSFSSASAQDCNGGNNNGVSAEKLSKSISISSSGALGCVNTPIKLQYDSVTKVTLGWVSETANYVGFCLYNGKVDRCINSSRFYKSNSDNLIEIEETFATVVNSNDNYSLNLYAPSKNAQVEVSFSKVVIETFPIGRQENQGVLVESFSHPFSKDLDSSSLYIPRIYGLNSYSLKPGYSWESSTGMSSGNSIESSSIRNVASNGIEYQYSSLFSIESQNPYLYYISSSHRDGFPSYFCVQHSNSSRCLTSMLFDYMGSKDLLGIGFSEDSIANLTVSLRTQSYSRDSENILKDLIIYEIPSEWLRLSFKSDQMNELPHTTLKGLGSQSVSYIYKVDTNTSNISSVYSIPETKSSFWHAYHVNESSIVNNIPDFLKPWLLYMFNTSENHPVEVNGWMQGWYIDDVQDGTLYVFYTPNLLGYLGYLILLIVTIIIAIKNINYFRNFKRAK